MSDVVDRQLRDGYRRGVEEFLQGRPEQAVEALEPVAETGLPEARLALGKALLELRQGERALEQFLRLLEDGPTDSGLLGYLHLLAASAAALAGREEEAVRHGNDALTADSRMEHAAHALRRRLEKGRPPQIRF
jgi:tetratricopeptide (TPR) repeat protein